LTLKQHRALAWVTGADGFLGRHVGLALTKIGYEVSGFVRNPDSNAELTSSWGYCNVDSGPFDRALLQQALNRAGPPAIVFHAIGSGSVAQADTDPAADQRRTLQTTECLLGELTRSAPGARLIYPSSAAVYGITPRGPVSEDAPTSPISAYGANKVAAEAKCFDFARGGCARPTIVRFFSVYGPLQQKLLLWDIGQRLLAGERTIVLGGTGEETRDYLYVTDAAAIVTKIATATSPPALVNAGSGKPTTVRTLVETLAAALGVSAEFHFDGHSRPGNPPHQQADISTLARLGFAVSVPLEQGISAYARWMRDTNR
jgi:UDP-glucose 4-epimerase